MKNSLKIAFSATVLLLGYSSLNAQILKTKTLEKLSLSPQVGLLQSWGDFNDRTPVDVFTPSFNKIGFGLLLNYKINSYLSVSSGLTAGKLEDSQDNINTTGAANNTRDLGFGIMYKTNLLELTFPRIDLNITRLIFKDNSKFFNKTSIGLIASHGLVMTDAKVYAQQEEGTNLLYGKHRGRSGKTNEAVTSYGMSLSYILNDKFDLSFESTIRNVWNDRLDAWETEGSANDKYSFTSLGVVYHLKKRREVIKSFDIEEEEILVEEVKDEVKADSTMAEVVEEKADSTLADTPVNSDDTNVNEETPAENEVVDLDLEGDETVFGKYTYKELAMSNTALVVLNSKGEPVDTIYTDQFGAFKYQQLYNDGHVSIIPLNREKLSEEEMKFFLTDSEGNKTKQLAFDPSSNIFTTNDIAEEEEAVASSDKKEIQLSEDEGYFIVVAAFRKMASSELMVEVLEAKGEKPFVIRNLQDSWNLVTLKKFENKAESLREMKKVRLNGFPNAWVHVKIK